MTLAICITWAHLLGAALLWCTIVAVLMTLWVRNAKYDPSQDD